MPVELFVRTFFVVLRPDLGWCSYSRHLGWDVSGKPVGLCLWPTPGIGMTVVRCLDLLVSSSPECSFFPFEILGLLSASIGTIGNRYMSGRGRPGMIPRRGSPLPIHDTL